MIISAYEKKPFDKIVIHEKYLIANTEKRRSSTREKASTKVIKINWKIKKKIFNHYNRIKNRNIKFQISKERMDCY